MDVVDGALEQIAVWVPINVQLAEPVAVAAEERDPVRVGRLVEPRRDRAPDVAAERDRELADRCGIDQRAEPGAEASAVSQIVERPGDIRREAPRQEELEVSVRLRAQRVGLERLR